MNKTKELIFQRQDVESRISGHDDFPWSGFSVNRKTCNTSHMSDMGSLEGYFSKHFRT